MRDILSEVKFNIVVDVSGLNKEQAEILYGCLDKTELETFLFISSSAVYDVNKFQSPYKEDSLLGENSYWTSYGQSKIEAEGFYRNCFEGTNTKLVILRPPYVYGENNYAQRESFIFDHICNQRPIIVPNKNTKLQFIYTTDLAKIIIELINSTLEGISIFNVGNKHAVSILEWITYCEKVVGQKARIIEYDYKASGKNERDFFPFFNYDNVLNVEKINKVYCEETDFIKGLQISYKWYIENMDSICFKSNIIDNEKEILKEMKFH